MKIKLYDHPLAVVEPIVFEANSPAEWLLSYYGETPSVHLQIYKGEPSLENDVSSDATELVYGTADYYTVLQSPGLAISAAQFLAQVAIAIAVSVVMSVLFPPPDMPGNVNRTQASPNNSLSNRENQVRLGQRVEDIYGTVESIPSLMSPTYYKYIGHKQMEYGYYCVGRGYYNITKLKEGDTLLTDINRSGARIYKPFTSPNSGIPQEELGEPISEGIITVSRPEQVNGLTLKALNQVQLPDSAEYSFSNTTGSDTITQATGASPNFNSIATSGDVITIDAGDFYENTVEVLMTADASADKFIDEGATGLFTGFTAGLVLIISGFTNPANNGTFTVTSVGTDEIFVSVGLVDEALVDAVVKYGSILDYSGTYTIDSVDDGVIVLLSDTWTTSNTSDADIKIVESLSDLTPIDQYTDWVTLSDPNRTQIWCNIIASNGLFADGGSGKQQKITSFQVEMEQLDNALEPTGLVEIESQTISGATSDERAITVEYVTSWTGPARVRIKRTNDYDYSFEGSIVDEIKWQDLYAVTPVDKLHFGNKTTIQTVSQATARATSIKKRQLNCIAARRLPVYNGTSFSGTLDSSGAISSGTISPTSKLVDILAAITTDPTIGGDIIQLDLPQVWAVQQELDEWDSEAGQFNFTFDSDTISFEESVTTVANAGFCLAYRQNGKIRLAFDKLQSSSSALFTHRNKKPDAETITRSFATDSEYDGVEFTYRDPDTAQTETIKLPLSGLATKYKKFEIPGIRSFKQAWYRANREYQKLLGQRLSIETECTADARMLLPNTRIDIVDNTRFKSYDGEVVKQDGLVLTLSREIAFTSGVHSILLMKRDGSIQSIVCTAGTKANQVVLAYAPAETIVTSPGLEGIRTIFSFASDDDRLSQAWLVQEVGLSDNQYIKVKAINYSPDYYYYDTQEVPDKDDIIND